jgi:hypothetical protein
MGVFRKLGAYTGHVDKDLLERGVLAPGLVIKCEPTRMGVGSESSGAMLPAKLLEDDPQMVTIDWDAALAEAGL